MPSILPASRQSLLLNPRWVDNGQDQDLGTATGFVTEWSGRTFLVTNRHVVTGQHQDTGDFLHGHSVGPTHIDVRHLAGANPRAFVIRREPLFDEHGVPRWSEHPTLGAAVDVVAFAIAEDEGITLMPHSCDARPDNQTAALLPTIDVSIVGFPFSEVGGGGLAIWTRGVIASEPALPYPPDDLPLFLVDSRTRPGQSGSPVIVQQLGGAVTMRNGSAAFGVGHTEVVGIYSGRINEQSDIGKVWNMDAIRPVLAAAYSRP